MKALSVFAECLPSHHCVQFCKNLLFSSAMIFCFAANFLRRVMKFQKKKFIESKSLFPTKIGSTNEESY